MVSHSQAASSPTTRNGSNRPQGHRSENSPPTPMTTRNSAILRGAEPVPSAKSSNNSTGTAPTLPARAAIGANQSRRAALLAATATAARSAGGVARGRRSSLTRPEQSRGVAVRCPRAGRSVCRGLSCRGLSGPESAVSTCRSVGLSGFARSRVGGCGT